MGINKRIKKIKGKANYFIINKFQNKFLRDFLIDKIITLTLYISLLLSAIYAGFHIILDIINNFTKTAGDKVPFTLKFAEDLFLYMLPLFVLFGFLDYYLNKLRFILLVNMNDKGKTEKSLNSLHTSKKIFFSSVLSYVVIKIITILFFNYDEKEKIITIDFNKLIAQGIFLLLLIVLVLIQHSSNNNEYD